MYAWEGVNHQGRRVRGEQAAASVASLKAALRRQGIVPRKVRRKLFGMTAIPAKAITRFVRQMATMLTAGIPIVQTLDMLASSQPTMALQRLSLAIKTDIEAGARLSETLRKYPKLFNGLLCNLIAVGEQSGTLDSMLKRITTYREKTEHLRAKVKKALIYPCAVMLVASLVTALLLVFVVPQFEALFQGLGAELPAITRFILQLSGFVHHYGGLGLGLVIGAGIILIQLHRRYAPFADWLDHILLKLPLVGDMVTKAVIARFARTLSITFRSGLPLSEALASVAGTTGNRVYARHTLKIRDSLLHGQSLLSAMGASKLFPAMVLQMIQIGEVSGTLESMLSNIADVYEAEVDATVDNLSSLLEPFLLVLLGLLVGGLVIGMYLPIFKLGNLV